MSAPRTSRDRIAEGVIAVTVAAAAWWTIALPAHERKADAESRLATAQAEIDAAHTPDSHDPLRIAAARDRVEAWTRDIADPLSAGAKLQRAADAAGVRIDRLTPAEDDEIAARGRIATATRRFEVVASGSASDIASMLDGIALQPLASVRSFDLMPGPERDEVIAVIIIETVGIALAAMQDAEDAQ